MGAYSEELLRFAKDNVQLVYQLERKWCEFIADRVTPSCQLKPMNRALRTMVHHYSDLWRIHTESFDPEPKRYINCVKMRDTKVPMMMLSEAARKWDGRPIVRPESAFPDLPVSRSESPPPEEQKKTTPWGSANSTYEDQKKAAPWGSANSAYKQEKDKEAMEDPRFAHMFKSDTTGQATPMAGYPPLPGSPPKSPERGPHLGAK